MMANEDPGEALLLYLFRGDMFDLWALFLMVEYYMKYDRSGML